MEFKKKFEAERIERMKELKKMRFTMINNHIKRIKKFDKKLI